MVAARTAASSTRIEARGRHAGPAPSRGRTVFLDKAQLRDVDEAALPREELACVLQLRPCALPRAGEDEHATEISVCFSATTEIVGRVGEIDRLARQFFSDLELASGCMDPRANRPPHHLRVSVVRARVTFRAARPFVGLVE